jgi:hypothetical protein
MTSVRNLLLWGGLLVLSACATQTLNPDQPSLYVINRNFTPFYTERPVRGTTTDISLNERTRVKLLRKGMGYNLVQLEDSRTGYVAGKNMSVAPPELQQTPFGSSSEEPEAKPRRKKRVSARPSPTPQPTPAVEAERVSPQSPPEPAAASPTPAAQDAPPKETPAPTPTPTPQATPLEKPKFRL